MNKIILYIINLVFPISVCVGMYEIYVAIKIYFAICSKIQFFFVFVRLIE